MVKGISRQVILVHSPGEELFDQAIFILKDDAVSRGVTDEKRLKEARQALRGGEQRQPGASSGLLWACAGSSVTAALWLLSSLL